MPPPSGELPAVLRSLVEESRTALLAAIGPDDDLTFVHGLGNAGDELIWAGARQLLSGRRYREIGPGDLARAAGRTVILTGGGGWCQPFHDLWPSLLQLAEQRFEKVVLFPSSFDLGCAPVRDALQRSRAVLFAREPESQRQAATVCDCRLALDTAFFFDFAPYHRTGTGELVSFRTDRESAAGELPEGNVDLSLAVSSLDEWLWTIARHAAVRTDRLHVAIAAALLGKRVVVWGSTYHKTPSLVSWALQGCDDVELQSSVAGAAARPGAAGVSSSPAPAAGLRQAMIAVAAGAELPAARTENGAAVTIVVVSWNRPRPLATALDSITATVRRPYRVVVVDNGSPRLLRDELAARAARDPHLELILLPENEGCGPARQRAVERATTPYVLILDDDAELLPGAADRLIDELERHPEALAATACVVLPDGRVHFCGGHHQEESGVLECGLLAIGARWDGPEVGPSGPCRWVAGGATAYRTAALRAEPLDPLLRGYYEDFEWCYRQRGVADGAFRRCVEALVLHHHQPPITDAGERPPYSPAFLEAMARFHERHGLVHADFFRLVPELNDAAGRRNVAAARLMLELVRARGASWLLAEWIGGGLAPLLGGRARRFVDALPPPAWVAHAAPGWAPSAGLLAYAAGSEAATLRRELQESRDAARRAQQVLERITGSRWWRWANRYWSFRRALGRRGR